MSDNEFPQELIERCGHAALVSRLQALRVLRESGHAELVAALKSILPLCDWTPSRGGPQERALDALAKAGAL